MPSRIKFFRDREQTKETERFLNTHGIRCFVRERSPSTRAADGEAFGFDMFVLRDEDIEEARKLLDYEFGQEWGEGVA